MCCWTTANVEPKIADMLAEPIVAALMASDGVERGALERMIETLSAANWREEIAEA